MSEAILGISAFYHDSAAVVIVDGEIVAAAQEERFSRKKHDDSFPVQAIRYVMEEAAISPSDLTSIAFYEKPFLKLERLLETYHAFAPRGLISFWTAIPVWMKEKLFIKKKIRDALSNLGIHQKKILFSEHHLSHAASAFYPSPFERAAILTIDGVGEWATMTIGIGEGNQISILKELHFPHSLGLLYSAFTYYLGFKVNGGEYKLMGLAPYGDPSSQRVADYKQKIVDHLIDLREDGSFLLNMDYFQFATGLRMVYGRKWEKLFDLPRRLPESELTSAHTDLALAIQQLTEEIILKLVKTARDLTQCKKLVMAGGVALNSVANGKILHSGIFEALWTQPAAGDAGGTIGAALAAWYIHGGHSRGRREKDDMKGTFLGPAFSNQQIGKSLQRLGVEYEYFSDTELLLEEVASLLAEGKVIGWFQGRMEFGPRALGNRSILADPRHPKMQQRLNLKIKKRESFRPFAPAVLEGDANKYFELDYPSPYMLLVAPVKEALRNPVPNDQVQLPLKRRLDFVRSSIPAVTHIDYSARIQTVNEHHNPLFFRLLKAFKAKTGCSVLVNTSFNVRGEPIVCTPEDAYHCFRNTGMDVLVMGNVATTFKSSTRTVGFKADQTYLGQTVQIIIDRPMGSTHPNGGLVYPINYGYIPGTIAGDGKEIDVYLLGVDYPVEEVEAKVIAVIIRKDDDENKLVASLGDKNYSLEEIQQLTFFQEQYFDVEIVMVGFKADRT